MNKQELIQQIKLDNPTFTDQDIVDYANTERYIDNINPPNLIEDFPTLEELTTIISPKERGDIIKYYNWSALIEAIESKNKLWLMAHIQNMSGQGIAILTDQTVTNLLNIINNPILIPDPNYLPKILISPVQENNLSYITLQDLQ